VAPENCTVNVKNQTSNLTDLLILKGELNPICHLLALLGAYHILHVSEMRVNDKGSRGIKFSCPGTQYYNFRYKAGQFDFTTTQWSCCRRLGRNNR